MARQRYDRASKWLIEHHGDQILRLAGVVDIVRWQAINPELVQPLQLPDGILEVERPNQWKAELFLIEIQTYADHRLEEQVFDDLMLIYQTKRVLANAVVLILQPTGQVQVARSKEIRSSVGTTILSGSWPVVELWRMPAAPLLDLHEPGLVPWLLLMQHSPSDEIFLQECRKLIDEKAPEAERDNLLTVSQILGGLCYNMEVLSSIFGGKEVMIESPILKELMDEREARTMQRVVLRFLKARFETVPTDIKNAIEMTSNRDKLDALVDWAGLCSDIDAFRQKLGS